MARELTSREAQNLTAYAWPGYAFELGIGHGPSFVRLRDAGPLPLAGSLDFDFPDQDIPPATDVFTLGSWEADRIEFGGGLLLPGQVGVGSNFSLDVPDILGASTYQFTIRGYPTPEPTSMTLFGLTAIGLALGCRRRSR